jgi:hypothetical protein
VNVPPPGLPLTVIWPLWSPAAGGEKRTEIVHAAPPASAAPVQSSLTIVNASPSSDVLSGPVGVEPVLKKPTLNAALVAPARVGGKSSAFAVGLIP